MHRQQLGQYRPAFQILQPVIDKKQRKVQQRKYNHNQGIYPGDFLQRNVEQLRFFLTGQFAGPAGYLHLFSFLHSLTGNAVRNLLENRVSGGKDIHGYFHYSLYLICFPYKKVYDLLCRRYSAEKVF